MLSAKDKEQFVIELMASAMNSIVDKIGAMPEEWDGIELRWYINDHVQEKVGSFKNDRYYAQRYKEYRNEVLVRNL